MSFESGASKPYRPIRLAILGSTGSIGTSTLDVIRAHPSQFEVVVLTANSNVNVITNQIKEFRPAFVHLSDDGSSKVLQKSLQGDGKHTEVLSGDRTLEELLSSERIDMVVAAIVGVAGLKSVYWAARSGKRIALANKESLVVAGALLTELAAKSGSVLVPVDSEHSAIFQALQGSKPDDVRGITLTASGGPFRNVPLNELKGITPERAVSHPNWNMGTKISIDSSTLVNKGLELIEAHWLFKKPESDIAVVVHPQSIVHSLLEFIDGSFLAQLSVPDMKGAIAYALTFPHGRLPDIMKRLDVASLGSLEFFPLDNERFPAVNLARQCLRSGGGAGAVFNAANEIAVGAFLKGRISYEKIVPFIADTLEVEGAPAPGSIEDLLLMVQELDLRIQQRLNERY